MLITNVIMAHEQAIIDEISDTVFQTIIDTCDYWGYETDFGDAFSSDYQYAESMANSYAHTSFRHICNILGIDDIEDDPQ